MGLAKRLAREFGLTDRQTLVVTGGAGHVATLISADLRGEFHLRRIDLARQEAADDHEVLTADAGDLDVMTKAFAGASGVLHLAAKAFEDDFRSILLPRNVDATWAVYEAAVRAGVPRVVFARTGQTVAGHPLGVRVTPDMPATKRFDVANPFGWRPEQVPAKGSISG